MVVCGGRAFRLSELNRLSPARHGGADTEQEKAKVDSGGSVSR